MHPHSVFSIRMVLLTWLVWGCLALPAWAGSEPIDRSAIKLEYRDGNFEAVMRRIGDFQKRNPRCHRDDSLFIAKHLAVVYSSNPATREKGKYWMYQMLALSPSAHLLDMYVSEDIDKLFDKIRQEYLASRNPTAMSSDGDKADAVSEAEGMPALKPRRDISSANTPTKEVSPPSAKSNSTVWWLAGGFVAAAAAGAVTYLVVTDKTDNTAPPVGEPIILPEAGGQP